MSVMGKKNTMCYTSRLNRPSENPGTPLPLKHQLLRIVAGKAIHHSSDEMAKVFRVSGIILQQGRTPESS